MKAREYIDLLDEMWDLRLSDLENKRVVEYSGDDLCCSIYPDLPETTEITAYARALLDGHVGKETNPADRERLENIYHDVFIRHSDDDLLGPCGIGVIPFWSTQTQKQLLRGDDE